MEITIGGDRSCALRLLGFLQTTKGIKPALSVFGDAEMGAFAETYMNACKEKGLRWSSLANYSTRLDCINRPRATHRSDRRGGHEPTHP
eukprot:5627473-Prymnesium_polylepis.1